MNKALSLLVLLTLALAACGPTATPTSVPPTAVPTVAPTAVPTVEPTAEPTQVPPGAEVPKTLRLPDLAGKTVVAVTGNDYTPLNFVDPKTGKAVGWEYDAVNEICRRLNCVVDWQVTSWDTMIAAVKEGQFDVGMDGITITDERKQEVDFSDPYMTSQQFMLVRADESRFTTPQEFAADEELLIGSQTGTTNFYVAVYEVLDGDEANPRIKLFENFGATVQALIAGDVDMVLMDAASSRGYIGANPDKLKLIGDPLGTEEFGFIFTPGSDLVAPFNAAIAQMKADGYLEYLNTRWFFLTDPNAADVYDQLPDLDGQDGGGGDGQRLYAAELCGPEDGQGRRLGVRRGERDLPAAELHGGLAGDVVGHDDRRGEGRAVRRGDGRHHHHRRAQAGGGLFRSVHDLAAVHAGAGGREPLHARRRSLRPNEELLIGSQTGTTNFYVAVYEVLDGDEANPRIKLFENFGATVQALIAGDVDMVLMDAASSRGYIGANPDKLKLIGDPLGTEQFGFIFTPGSDLVAPFNAAIKTMADDGFLDHLNTRWFFLYDPTAQ